MGNTAERKTSVGTHETPVGSNIAIVIVDFSKRGARGHVGPKPNRGPLELKQIIVEMTRLATPKPVRSNAALPRDSRSLSIGISPFSRA